MTDVCGVFVDRKHVCGILLASKHGLHSVKCKNFIDASDNVLFSRQLFGQDSKALKAGFVMELLNVDIHENRYIEVPSEAGILNNLLTLHPGKNADNQVLLEFEFDISTCPV